MSEVHISVEMTFRSVQPATDDQFEAFLDEVAVQLANIGCDVNIATRLTARRVDFASTITADGFPSATMAFLTNLRAALHATGCVTADWPDFQPSGHVIRELQDA